MAVPWSPLELFYKLLWFSCLLGLCWDWIPCSLVVGGSPCYASVRPSGGVLLSAIKPDVDNIEENYHQLTMDVDVKDT